MEQQPVASLLLISKEMIYNKVYIGYRANITDTIDKLACHVNKEKRFIK